MTAIKGDISFDGGGTVMIYDNRTPSILIYILISREHFKSRFVLLQTKTAFYIIQLAKKGKNLLHWHITEYLNTTN